MAYKQPQFPTHMSTVKKSPTEQWEWYDENVANQGYGSSALTGASYGAQLGGPWGAVIGAAVGVGANAVKVGIEKDKEYERLYGHLDKKNVDYVRGGSEATENYDKWLAERAADKKIKDKERWAVMTENNKMTKLEEKYDPALDSSKMAQAKRKLQKMQENPQKHIDKSTKEFVPEETGPYIPPTATSNSMVAQLNNRAGRSPQSNTLNPIMAPFSTNQNALNGNDPTNLAVKYAQFNSIAQDLTPITPIQQTEREERKAKTKAWNEEVERKKQAKYDLKKRAKKAGTSVREQKSKEFWNKGPKVAKTTGTGKPTDDIVGTKNQLRYLDFLQTKPEDKEKWNSTPMGWNKEDAKKRHLESLNTLTSHGTVNYEDEPVKRTMYLDDSGNFVEK